MRNSCETKKQHRPIAITSLQHTTGLEINTDSAVVGANGKPIPGLYCAGEVMGGVHGNNRLGGNSLLDCVVYGRVAGQNCAKYMLGSKGESDSRLVAALFP